MLDDCGAAARRRIRPTDALLPRNRFQRSPVLRHPIKFIALLLLAASGHGHHGKWPSIIAFLSLELASFCSTPCPVSKTAARPPPKGAKDFLTNGMSVTFLLFGFSLLYGSNNTL